MKNPIFATNISTHTFVLILQNFMKNLLIRALTGIVYIAIIIAALFTTLPVFFTIFGIIMLFVLNEFYKNLKIKGIEVDIIITNVLAICVYAMPIIHLYSKTFEFLPAVILFTLVLFAIELFRDDENPFHRIAFGLCGIIYTCVPFTLLAYYKIAGITTIGSMGSDFASLMILLLFIFTWSNDVFAYLTGMLLGKHPLCPKISPKKTIEGFIGGLIFTIAISVIIANYYKAYELIGLAVLIVIFSTLGDLVESRLKRYIGVKDSGKMLPGHGGFLDRFDSVLFAIPAFFAYLQLLN